MEPLRPRMGPETRLSDADREAAVASLSEHYAVGRLDKDEFDERSDAVWTAKTRGDLAPVFADLGPDRRELRRPPRRRPRGWWPLPFAPVLLVLIALTVLTHIPFILLALVGCVFVARRRRWYR
jgi:hypothetical protein